MSKNFRSTWFRVAVEGGTTDKRKIERKWLEQAAKNFNRATYGARVWLEHLRGTMPDGPFKAYGDVLSLKAEEVDIAGTKRLGLFAQIEPTDDLVAMNKAKQKLYTSIEIDPSFADTGEAYMVGLGVTDSPASLGTDVLAFSAQNPDSSPFRDRHFSADSMFTEALETRLEFEQVEPGIGVQLLGKVQELLRGKAKSETEFTAVSGAVEALAEHGRTLADQFAAEQSKTQDLSTQVSTLRTELADLKTSLGKIQDFTQTKRPVISGGGSGQPVTDC
ncbi:GPO family capsid scaffolding protein [Pseudomonas sp. RIT-PI-AD]|uniref:GPO family capsid scaffolding protein n=1 Tax=Pseudomonas sp. RIT-PI-AD TaxID=3035294 RepID=UPI0021D99B88|nr:GPO family capsid scaffolding protein [Pseudomonas sp. RIT-PI-AD]